jgi:DNA-binding GntR family transcriptional regulator
MTAEAKAGLAREFGISRQPLYQYMRPLVSASLWTARPERRGARMA